MKSLTEPIVIIHKMLQTTEVSLQAGVCFCNLLKANRIERVKNIA